MQIFLDDVEKPLITEARLDQVLAPEATVLRIEVPADEELASASLTLYRYDGDDPEPFSMPPLETDAADGSFNNISWIKADWGSARTIRKFRLHIANPDTLLIRVQIARGGGGWFSPPGPHTFKAHSPTANVILAGSFPDTVADRVMFEFLHENDGVPVQVTLLTLPDSTEPLDLVFGHHARDIGFRVATRRDFFTHAGELTAGQPIEVADLLDTLRAEFDAAIADGAEGSEPVDVSVSVEIEAAVAGHVELEWEFAHTTIIRRFANDSDTRALDLPWSEPVSEPLVLDPPGRPESFAVSLASEPVRERIALMPQMTDPLGEALAVLCRPLYDNAQPFSLALDMPLVGVDLWARVLTPSVKLAVDVRADDGGRPASEPSEKLSGTVERSDGDPGQLAFVSVAFDAPALPPVENPGDRFWLFVTVEDGELVWFSSDIRPDGAGTPRYRRGSGEWLERPPGDAGPVWSVTRLRVLDTGPPPPIESSLILIEADNTRTTVPLTASSDGFLRWNAADLGVPAPQVERLDVQLTSIVASSVSLSNLRLTYREDS